MQQAEELTMAPTQEKPAETESLQAAAAEILDDARRAPEGYARDSLGPSGGAAASGPNTAEGLAAVGLGDEPLAVLPHAVDLRRFKAGPRDPALVARHRLEGQLVLLFIGRMAANKRIDTLVRGLAALRRAVEAAADEEGAVVVHPDTVGRRRAGPFAFGGVHDDQA